MAQCKEVIHQLKRLQHTTWSITLNSLSPQSLLTILTDINGCQVWRLYIYNTPFDSNSVSQLSKVLTDNITMERLHLSSSPLVPDTYHLLTTAIASNKIIERLYLYNDINITDEDIPHLSNLLTNSSTLQLLWLNGCPKITKSGQQQLQDVCFKSNSLKYLYVNGIYHLYR